MTPLTDHVLSDSRCAVCGCTQDDLTTECPGFVLDAGVRAKIREGVLNYRRGRWAVETVNVSLVGYTVGYAAGFSSDAPNPYDPDSEEYRGYADAQEAWKKR